MFFVVVLGILFKYISIYAPSFSTCIYTFRTSDSLSLVREMCFCLLELLRCVLLREKELNGLRSFLKKFPVAELEFFLNGELRDVWGI